MNMVRGNFDIGKKQTTGKVDLVKMKEGGLDAMFFAAFVGQRPRTDENYQEAYQTVHQMIDTMYTQVERNQQLASVALTAEDASIISKQGKRAIYIGIENGFALAKDIRRVEEFYNKGARYITLSHSYHNDICDSSTDRAKPEHNGLSAFGREVVREMNRLGMIVDVSHISDKAFFDVIKESKAPVIASHSSVRALANNDRNMTDEMISALAKNGGVIQICLLSDYVKDPDTTTVRYKKDREMRAIYNEKWDTMSDDEKTEFRKQWTEVREKYPRSLANVADLVNHIDHVAKLVGIDYVGIGSDFDGGGGLSGCNDVSEFPNITREMLKRGYSEEDILKVWGGNFFRAFRQVEEYAATAHN
jgi:membrane dipeptidase